MKLMKARMLCFLFASTMTPVMAKAMGPDFSALIEKAEQQTERAHTESLEATKPGETVSFYNNDWLNLRHRKRFAIAQVEVKLKKNKDKKTD